MRTYQHLLTSLAAAGLLWACGPQADDLSPQIDSADLELEYGGLDEADEAPLFGDAGFALVDEGAEDLDSPDARDSEDPARTRPADYVDLSVNLLWGQLRADPTVRQRTDWSGTLSVQGAAIARVRAIRFEAGDQIAPRDSRGQVAWRSHTGPHHDGLQVLLRVPLADSTRADRSLHLRTASFSVEIPLRELAHLERVVDVGANQVAINAFIIRPGDCNSGVLRGHWGTPNARGVGRLMGRWVSSDGTLQGHLRGKYGVRRSGEKVFFAKVINAQGRFIGRLAGRYDAGEFNGRWMVRGGDRGAVSGRYRAGAEGQGGAFVGRWAERCEAPTTMPPQPERPQRGETADDSGR